MTARYRADDRASKNRGASIVLATDTTCDSSVLAEGREDLLRRS